MRLLSTLTLTCFAVALLAIPGPTAAQEPSTANGEWPSYGGNLSHDRYSPLDRITADNFNELELAWRFNTDNLGPRPETNYQSTPLMVNGILYVTAGSRRAVVALDPETGELIQNPDTTSFDPETEIQKILDSREAINKNNYRNKLLRDVGQSENDRLQRQEASKDTEIIYSIRMSKSELRSITRDEIEQYLHRYLNERLEKIIQQHLIQGIPVDEFVISKRN